MASEFDGLFTAAAPAPQALAATPADAPRAAAAPASPAAPAATSEFAGLFEQAVPKAAPVKSAPGVESFVSQYLPLAQRVGEEMGVAPHALLGQWGLETGWGKSIIPGTNNLGNIKDFSGRGVSAVDNMTKRSDAYQRFGSADEFGDHYTGLMARRYKNTFDTGEDTQNFFTALKMGGYAEDPNYIRSGVAAANQVAQLLGKNPQAMRSVKDGGALPGTAVGEDTSGYSRLAGAPPAPPLSAMGAVKDSAVALGAGIVRGAGMLANSFGADNPVARGLDGAAKGIESFESPARAAEKAARAQTIRTAEQSGSTWEEIKAYGGSFMEAPLDTTLGAIGTSAPTLLMALVPGLGQAGAVRFIAQGAMGAVQGAGSVKGSIYDEVTQKLIDNGATPDEARKVAAGAQAYDSANGGNIAIGAILGAAASTTGAEAGLARIVHGAVGKKAASGMIGRTAMGVAGEAPIEALQGGQEKYASNVALQGVGIDTPAWQGVAGSAVLEGMAAAPMGGAVGLASGGARVDPLADIEAQRRAELAPVAEAAAAGGTLSKAAMAGNDNPIAAAQYADAQLQADTAQQQATQAEQASNAPVVDPLTERVRAIAEQARSNQLLNALRAEDSPVNAKQFVNDLAIAQSPSARPDQREQALTRLEYAAAWATGAEPLAPVEAAAKPAAGASSVATANDLLSSNTLSDVDRETLVTSLAASTNPALPQATRQAARQAANEVIGRNTASAATAPLAPGASTPALFAPKAAPAGSPEEVRAKARQQEDNAGQLTAMGYPDEAATATAQADLLREEGAVRAGLIAAPAATEKVAADAQPASAEKDLQPAGVDVAAPLVAVPAGTGTAQFRKRRATLAALIKDGLSTVERRNDGNFYLVDSTRKRQFKLDGAVDAALARKAKEDTIREGANLANTAPTEGQAAAGNYKKGRVEFDGLKLGIENPIGSTRSGKAPDGKPWSVTMTAHYGDLTGTTGADGDGVDIYLAAKAQAGSPVFVVDQYNADGSFDEHKAIVGAADEAQALKIYDAHFSDGSGPRRRKAVSAMSVADFKAWAASPAAKQPAGKPNGPTRSVPEQTAAQGPAAGAPLAGPRLAGGKPVDGRSDAAAGDRGKPNLDTARADAAVPGVAAADSQGTATSYVTIRVDGRERQVALVNELAANDASPPRADGARRINKANAGLLRKLAGALGKQVQFFSDTTLGDGFVDPATPNTIYLNETSTIHPLAVFGHEFLHTLRQSMPAAHASLMKVVQAKLKKDGAHKFRNDYYKADAGPNPNNALNNAELEEITSDIGGNFMADTAFWAEVFAQVAKDSPAASKSLIGRMATQLYKLVDKLADAIKQGGFGSSKLVNDLNGVRAAFKDALAQYLVANGVSQAGLRAESLKAEQAAQAVKASAARTQDDLFPGEFAGKRATVTTERVVSSKGATEQVKRGNVNSAGQQITATRQGLENFWDWFGDSEIVDGTGKPLLLYHSTNADVSVLKPGQKTSNNYGLMGDLETTRSAVFATANKAFSQEYLRKGQGQNVMPVYMSLQEPFDVSNGVSAGLVQKLKAAGIYDQWYASRQDWELYDNDSDGTNSFVDKLKALGYDGAIFNEEDENGDEQTTYAAFDSNQIKSATGNNGVFGKESQDITRSAARSPATGIHFSQQQRSEIDGRQYGSGMKGQEIARLNNAKDARLLERAYVYIDEGQGVKPETGVGTVPHEIRLPKLYDARANPDKLWNGGNLNTTESAILDAGFGGYYVSGQDGRQGTAVVLGQASHALAARPITEARNGAPGAAPAKASRGLMSKELNALEPANIPGATLKNGTLTIPMASREAANDEMSRIGSAVRFSAARAADAPAIQYAAIEAQTKGTPQWLKAPNGKATNLTQQQWVHVRTPSFKSWFGDWEKFAGQESGVWNDDKGEVSKAVDDNGEPLVVYHGTDEGGFTEFLRPGGTGRGDLGIFTTSNHKMASSYVKHGRASDVDLTVPVGGQDDLEGAGFTFEELDDGRIELSDPDGEAVDGPSATGYRFASMEDAVAAANKAAKPEQQSGVYALFLNLRTPNEASFEGANWDGSRSGQYIIENAEGEQLYAANGNAYFTEAELDTQLDQLNAADTSAQAREAGDHYETTDSVVREARKDKLDGAIIRQVKDEGSGRSSYGGEPSDVFVAFAPNQLKSADFNDGRYGVATDDIRFSPPRQPAGKRPARDPALGDKTDVAKLPKGKPIPASAAIGSLEDSLALARSKSYAKGRQLKVDLQARVLAAAKAAKVDLTERTQETHKFLTALVVKDAKLALESNANAIGWYDKTVSRAIGALATVHPEIETDPKARLAFLWALATTSNGLKVGINFKIAEEVYRGWKATGVMPSDAGIGNAKAAIDKGLALYNTLRAKMGDERLFAFMATEFKVGQIGGMLGEKPGGEWMPTPVLGSAVLGPKIGNGFFSNLNGYFDALTMDRWLMRTWGRMTGTLIETQPEKVAKSRAKLGTAIASMNDTERKLMAKLIGTPLRRSMTRAELDAVSLAVQKVTMKPDNRDVMDASPGSSRLRLDGNGHAKMLDGQKEAPAGPGERNWIRAVFTQALGELNTGGKAMTMSDLQALLWYPERRLYDAAKSDEDVANGYADDEAPDYANAAQELAARNGIKPEVIRAAMDRAEKRGTVQGKRLSEAEKAAMLQEFRAPPGQAVQLAFEVAPDPADAALTAQWGQLSLKQRTAITQKVKDAVLDEVIDAVGAKVGKTVGATGGFAGLVNPNLITDYKPTQVPIEQARALAAALGMALDQDSVALVDPRAADTNGLVRIKLSGKADKHAAEIMKAIQSVSPGTDGFTARGNNFDVLNFPGGVTTEELAGNIADALEDLDFDAAISFGEAQSELVEKANYGDHIQRLRPGAGPEILARVERARDRARELVAQEIRSASDRGVQPGARPGTGRAAAARLDDGASVQRSPARDEAPAAGRADPGAVPDAGRVRGGPGVLAGTRRPYQVDGRLGRTLEGLPARVTVDDQPVVFAGFKPAQDAAAAYMAEAGLAYTPPATYAKVDPARATRVANAFESLKHAPQDPGVKAAYGAMIQETMDQYEAILKTGLKVEFNDGGDPYGNPRNAILDVVENNHLFVFSTQEGFGSSELDVAGNPLLAPTAFTFAGKPTLANDIFRVVHDYFGHIKEGVGFRADGEENAWRAHAAMYSPLARRAMTTETRGQNSWVNYGPKAEFNRTANGGDTIYADQKVGLLPQWVSEEGAGDTILLADAKTSGTNGKQNVSSAAPSIRPEALIDLRKRRSVLESLKTCLGRA